jgi:NADH:ubiquinone oxidoreductase subunit 4 (subunit M)
MLDPVTILLASAGILLMGFSKAGFGGGLGILTTPLCVLAFARLGKPPVFAIGFVLPLLVIADAASLFHYWKKWEISNLRFLIPGVVAGVSGAVLQMVNHALVVVPVFLIIAMLYERFGTDDLTKMGGMATRAPVLAALFLVVTMATLAIPGSSNFIGEFYILNAVFQVKIVYAIVASVGVVLAAFYALRFYQRSMHNRLPEGIASREVSWRENLVVAPLVVCIVALAFYPGLILERGEDSVGASVAAVDDARTNVELARR